MIGNDVSKTQLDSALGKNSAAIKYAFDQAILIKEYLDTKTEQDLIGLGYTSGEVAVMKSAYTDVNQLATIFTGAAALGVAKDFRTFLKQLWGLDGIEV